MEIIRLISLLVPSILLAYSLALISTASATKPFFLFGDSFLDAGNNNYINTSTVAQANFYPYGITFFHYPTGRCCDGRLVCEFVVVSIYIRVQAIDLHMQLRNYKKMEKWLTSKLGEVGATKRLRRALFMFSVGTNDYATLFLTNNTFLTNTQSQYVDMVIGNITSVVTEIYNTGERKFAFLNVPPIGCVRHFRIHAVDGSCLSESLSYTKQHNKALLRALRKLEKQLPGFKFSP
ncbi:hypothetical protein Cgig2_024130 [Carnegiea gigantea]|uniref:Uncharacterized protein n=1 Tax=Carnegiea gigantea TaxID=171969 RepID=A0A9Q1JVG3_9CARY|nr:hypothetical protein Cgig2_024130 [Carnegiea gigantea]